MYEAFYGLNEKPFSLRPNPAYLYLSERYKFAFSVLEYGVGEGAAFTVITGEIGCGKTTLIRHLLNRLDDEFTVGLISNTPREADELLRSVLLAFAQPYEHVHRVGLLDQLQQFLVSEYAAGRRSLVIVDEAQNLSPASLEELRMLANINAEKEELLQIVLVGQPQLKTLLRRPDLHQLAQRVAADFHLPRLEPVDVARYVFHRLAVAGRETALHDTAAVKQSSLFDAAAILRIGNVAQGVPRTINLLCDMSLVYGYSVGADHITRGIVDEVIADKSKYGVFRLGNEATGNQSQPDLQSISSQTAETFLRSTLSGEQLE